jgi:hypothetical protein
MISYEEFLGTLTEHLDAAENNYEIGEFIFDFEEHMRRLIKIGYQDTDLAKQLNRSQFS